VARAGYTAGRKRRGKRGAAARPRSLAELLYVQAVSFKKQASFPELVAMLNASVLLRGARLGQRPWKLLAEPRLKPEHLPDFYATYRLPKSPFFELFLRLKWAERERKAMAKADRAGRIRTALAAVPEPFSRLMAWLGALESTANPKKPLWKARYQPRSIKSAGALASLEPLDWKDELANALLAFRLSYPGLRVPDPGRLFDLAMLESLPDARTGREPDADTLRAGWRLACKRWHPDSGGSSDAFRLVEDARRRLGV